MPQTVEDAYVGTVYEELHDFIADINAFNAKFSYKDFINSQEKFWFTFGEQLKVLWKSGKRAYRKQQDMT